MRRRMSWHAQTQQFHGNAITCASNAVTLPKQRNAMTLPKRINAMTCPSNALACRNEAMSWHAETNQRHGTPTRSNAMTCPSKAVACRNESTPRHARPKNSKVVKGQLHPTIDFLLTPHTWSNSNQLHAGAVCRTRATSHAHDQARGKNTKCGGLASPTNGRKKQKDGGGGTNRSDAGLNLSGSWQQGHSATYNTPSRI